MIGFACRSHGARCTRATAFSIHVWSALLVAPAVAAAQTSATYLAIGSDAGDSIGRGQPAYLDASNASFSGTRLHIVGFTETTDKIDITVQPTGVSGSWRIVLTS